MYGTVARLRPKTGQERAVIDWMMEWQRERKPKVKGAVGAYVVTPDKKPNELVLVAIFDNQQTYRANADDPEQDQWFQRLRQYLEADPEWEDGEVLSVG